VTLRSGLVKQVFVYTKVDIRFYTNDCKGNKLPECDSPQKDPLTLMYNRVMIKYNGNPDNLERIDEII